MSKDPSGRFVQERHNPTVRLSLYCLWTMFVPITYSHIKKRRKYKILEQSNIFRVTSENPPSRVVAKVTR